MIRIENEFMLNPIEEIIQDIRDGRMIVMVDDEDRENEGDLLIAADRITAEQINFMATHARGLICLTLTEERCRRLGLELMVNNNNARYATNFTVSIEAARGVTTGISAADRATTVLSAVSPEAGPDDIVAPGSYLSGHGTARRCVDPGGAHRGGGRPGAAGRVRARQRDLRNPQNQMAAWRGFRTWWISLQDTT